MELQQRSCGGTQRGDQPVGIAAERGDGTRKGPVYWKVPDSSQRVCGTVIRGAGRQVSEACRRVQ